MTIQQNIVTLWDNGTDKLNLFSVPESSWYNYVEGLPCITIGLSYENESYKGCDIFTFFDRNCVELLDTIKDVFYSLNGSFRLYDMGADTDGYVDFEMSRGQLHIKGQLGASFSSHFLMFGFDADQTLLETLIQSILI